MLTAHGRFGRNSERPLFRRLAGKNQVNVTRAPLKPGPVWVLGTVTGETQRHRVPGTKAGYLKNDRHEERGFLISVARIGPARLLVSTSFRTSASS